MAYVGCVSPGLLITRFAIESWEHIGFPNLVVYLISLFLRVRGLFYPYSVPPAMPSLIFSSLNPKNYIPARTQIYIYFLDDSHDSFIPTLEGNIGLNLTVALEGVSY